MKNLRIGVITALPIEARCFLPKRLSIGQTSTAQENLVLHIAGMGAACAKKGALQLLEHKVDALISWGTAGGLCPSLRPGQLLVPEYVFDAQGNSYLTHTTWQQHLCDTLKNVLSIHSGPLLQSTQIIHSTAAKRSLLEDYQAVAVDMESAAIAAVASQAGLPFIAIRAITDASHVAMPTWLTGVLNAKGKVRPHAFVQKLLCAPHTWPAFFNLIRGFSAAKTSLKTAAEFQQHFFIDFAAAKYQNTRLQY